MSFKSTVLICSLNAISNSIEGLASLLMTSRISVREFSLSYIAILIAKLRTVEHPQEYHNTS